MASSPISSAFLSFIIVLCHLQLIVFASSCSLSCQIISPAPTVSLMMCRDKLALCLHEKSQAMVARPVLGPTISSSGVVVIQFTLIVSMNLQVYKCLLGLVAARFKFDIRLTKSDEISGEGGNYVDSDAPNAQYVMLENR